MFSSKGSTSSWNCGVFSLSYMALKRESAKLVRGYKKRGVMSDSGVMHNAAKHSTQLAPFSVITMLTKFTIQNYNKHNNSFDNIAIIILLTIIRALLQKTVHCNNNYNNSSNFRKHL